MKTSIEHVTPEKARKYLDGNYGNRVVRQPWVENLAGMILRGEFLSTHQGIAFGKDGRLLDGQHRLLAILKAGKAVDIMVTHDLDEEAFRHIDGGRSRSYSDRIKLLADEKENAVAVMIVRSYLVAAVLKNGSSVTVDLMDNCFLTMADAFATVASEFRNRSQKRGLMRASVGAAITVYIHKHGKPGERFLDQFVSGKDLGEKSPVLVLRESLIAGRAGKSEYDGYWKTVSACKAHKEGREMAYLTAASEDWMGNKYLQQVFAKKRAGDAGAETKKVARIRAMP